MFDSPPTVVRFAINLHEDLVQMPSPIYARTRMIDPIFPYLSSKNGTKPVSAIANGFMTNTDAPFMKKVFHIAERKWKPHIHHDGQPDDLGRRLEIAKRVVISHLKTIENRPSVVKTGLVCRPRSGVTAMPARSSHNVGTTITTAGPIRAATRSHRRSLQPGPRSGP